MIKADNNTSSRQITIYPEATALTIAGSDPSGGAGLQADLKTFQQLGVYGMSAVTLVTVQNTKGVRQVEVLDPALTRAQIAAVLEDIPPKAIKTGALGTAEMVRTVSGTLAGLNQPIVVDPVLVSKHGDTLANDEVVEAYQTSLLKHATIVTPNRFEAEKLTGIQLVDPPSTAEAIARLQEFGAEFVLLKLGEQDGQSKHIFGDGQQNTELSCARLGTASNHGSGCVLSAVITSLLALGATRDDLLAVMDLAIVRTLDGIAANTSLGSGIHPVDVRAVVVDPGEWND